MERRGQLLVIDLHLHEAVLRRNADHADGRAGAGQRDARPAEVADRRIRRDPVALRVIEQRIGGQAAIALFDAVGMQADRVGRVEAEGRVVGLDARPPYLAVVRADQQVGMRVDGQEQPAATARQAVVADVVVGERGVVVPDQQAVLIREVLDPICQAGLFRKPKLYGPVRSESS